jgi:hypothetical protein
MFTISEIVGHLPKRILECVWSLSNDKLTCAWVERSFQYAADERPREEVQVQSQRVA